jgi:hypothetical protein
MPETTAAVETMPSLTIGAMFQQRARWGSKTMYYNILQVLLLSGVFLFYVVITGLLLFSLFDSNFIVHAVVLLCCKFSGECLLMIPGLRIYKKQQLFPLLPIASLLQLPLVIGAIFVGIFGKFSWKGQSFSRTIRLH